MTNQESTDSDTEYSENAPKTPSVSRRSILRSVGVAGISGFALSNTAATVDAHTTPDHMVQTPPMGWNTWNTFRCDINADLIKETADTLVETGLKDAGYEYLNLDDCWMAHERNADGKLEANPDSFPNGMKNIGDYLHNNGLKFGIYESAGTVTCAAEYDDYPTPGCLNHEETDAQTFADWGVDYLKYDNCGDHLGIGAKTRFERMWNALDATGRDIVKSQCSWGSYNEWTWAPGIGSNLWRTTNDITDDWGRIMDILDQQVGLAQYAGPGHWNDPDMLEVGNDGLSEAESRAHFSLWCLLAAPLIIGNDIRNMSPTTREILLNEAVIAVDQDPAGIQGTKRRDDGDEEVWAKPLENGDVAVILFNRGESPATITTTANEVGIRPGRGSAHRPKSSSHHARNHGHGSGYVIHDLWEDRDLFTTSSISATVEPHDVAMFRVRTGTPNEAPPLITVLGEDDKTLIAAGEAHDVSVRFANHGGTAVQNVALEIAASDNWEIEPSSRTTFGTVAPGETVEEMWSVKPPSDVENGTYNIGAHATYRWKGETLSRKGTVDVVVVPVPPSEDTYLSDMEWLEATNGWGPVERDMSLGDNYPEDGGPITIDGTTYEKGLGVNAPSTISYYLGGNFATFAADIGVDDEVDNKGSVTFEVWKDGEKAYESSVVEGSDGSESVAVDVSDTDLLELTVTDGGDGDAYDHADWAGAQVLIPADGSEGPPAVGDSNSSPTDPDGDGLYEDVDGDGAVTNADGDALFAHFEDPAVQNRPEAYDFNGNDRLDLDDIVEWRKEKDE